MQPRLTDLGRGIARAAAFVLIVGLVSLISRPALAQSSANWRVYMLESASPDTPESYALAELEFYDAPGGGKFNIIGCSAPNSGSAYSCEQAVDADDSTEWVLNNTATAIFSVTFGAPVAVGAVTLQSRTDDYWEKAPTRFSVQYLNDSGVWVTLWSVETSGFGRDERRTFAKPTDDPNQAVVNAANATTDAVDRTTQAVKDLEELFSEERTVGNECVMACDVGQITSLANEIEQFQCPNGIPIVDEAMGAIGTISGLASFALGPFGGGAQLSVLIKQLEDMRRQIQNQLQQICQAKAQTGALTDPDPIGTLIIDDLMANPESAPLAAQYRGSVAAFPTTGDDVVTASNRTNQLLVANQQAQLQAFDRMMGGRPRINWEAEDGQRITSAVINSGGGGGSGAPTANMVMAEGEPGQNYDAVTAMASDLDPDFGRYHDVSPAQAEVTGSCFQNPDPPVGDGLEASLTRLRWNARQTLASSATGEFLCGIIDQPDRNPSEICFGPETPIVAAGVAVTHAEPICIYGSRAPSYIQFLITSMPVVLMLCATAGGVRMFL